MLEVPAGTQVASNPVNGISCIYTTIQDLKVLPLEITGISSENLNSDSTRVLVTLKSRASLKNILEDRLSFYFTGTYADASQRFLALLTCCEECVVKTEYQSLTLKSKDITPTPLSLTDVRLPTNRRTHRAYLELLRYFHFPAQLLSISISGLKRLQLLEDTREFSLQFHLHQGVSELPDFPPQSLALNVTPAVNVFRISAEPVVIDHTREEYLLRPQDGKQLFREILGVEKATALFPGGVMLPCFPYEFYDETRKGIFYSLRYRFSEKDGSIEHLITPLYRFDNHEKMPDRFMLSLELLCCNHLLPGSLQVGDICRSTDSSPAQAEFSNITAPSPMLPRSADESLQWRFLSLLNANLLSLAQIDALRSILELYVPESGSSPEASAANKRRVLAVTHFSSSPEEYLFKGRMLRGHLLKLTLDPAGFVSEGDLYLFANALERFFAEFANLNTYSRLHLTVGNTGRSYKWPPRLGEKQLI